MPIARGLRFVLRPWSACGALRWDNTCGGEIAQNALDEFAAFGGIV